ncbi:MAG: ABC transporter ATP-binding protein [Deltaproteobacteria bacterium]|nr:ABC transporter ATP-binding protein [Deltaproteobacteria bacterium]
MAERPMSTQDPKSPAGAPGTGTGPAGGAAVKPTPPSRDPAAEAAALAMFEADEAGLSKQDEPAGRAEQNMAKANASERAAATPKPADAAPPTDAKPLSITGGKPLMAELAKPLAKPPVVAFNKVTKTYGSGSSAFTAIKDVTFTIPDYPGRGEFISILGPSGCGKSTVIRMIAGLLPQFPQTSGTVLIDGKPVHGPGPDRGMVFQDYTSFDNRSVLENVAFGLECRGLTRALDGVTRKQTVAQLTTLTPHQFEKGMTVVIDLVDDKSFNGTHKVAATPSPTVFSVLMEGKPDATSRGGVVRVPKLSGSERTELAKHWIEKVGLSVKKDSDKYPHQLSGGMRQRVAIARTLILEPRIILMDEPFGALDPPTRSRMQDNLVALWREQSPTIFFITHSIEEAVFLGDHILIFSNSPGTVMKEIRVPPPDRPSIELQRDPKFIDIVMGIRETIDRLESSNRAGD